MGSIHTSDLVLFCFVASVLIVTPGPNFLYILTRGATQGRHAGLVAAAGLGTGVLMHTALATFGVAALVRSSYLAFRVIKYGGSLYLVYLGVMALRDRADVLGHTHAVQDTDYRVFWQSIVASMTNPKTTLFFLSFLPQFVHAAAGDAARQMLLLGAIYMLLTLIIYGSIGYFAGGVGRWLRTRDAFASRLRWLTATSFVGLGVWTALPDRR
jgi:threonine/homoserine/homoserine lactone efflux protein